MRIIESESKQGAYIFVIVGLITFYFGLYILTGIIFLMLLVWLFFCSSKLINPTTPDSIVTPISGKITKVIQNEDSIEFSITPRFNGRIFAPCDLHEISTLKKKGFYFFNQNKLANILGPKETLKAQALLNNKNIAIQIEVIPRLLKFCGINYEKSQALFLEKIGFLNFGVLNIKIIGNGIVSLVKEGEKVLGGSTQLIEIKNKDNLTID